MSELFDDKYRIPSARLQTWNYAQQGMYLITICTKDRACYFGKIVDLPKVADIQHMETQSIASVQQTDIGKVAQTEWHRIVELRPDMNLELGEFVVMPNHIHGILIINENPFNTATPNKPSNTFAPQSKNLASLIRGYKSAVTTYARKNNLEFEWQPRYHDHIIRSADGYRTISDYIINNPAQWQADKFYKQ